jgi:hypothetical protein
MNNDFTKDSNAEPCTMAISEWRAFVNQRKKSESWGLVRPVVGEVMPPPVTETWVESSGQKYRLATVQDFAAFKAQVMDDSGWTEKFKSDTVRVWTKAADPDGPGAGLNVVKVNAFFANVDCETMYDALHDPDFRKSWDANMLEGYNIVQLDERNDVGYYAAKFPFPLANRDFLNQRMWMEFDTGEYIIKNNSVPHRDCPEKKGFVRGFSVITGYYLRPWNGNGAELLYITHGDIKGSIPHMVLNSATQRMAPSMMEKLGKNGENYPQWARENHPAGFVAPWRTPKISWDYPNDQPKALNIQESSFPAPPPVGDDSLTAAALRERERRPKNARVKRAPRSSVTHLPPDDTFVESAGQKYKLASLNDMIVFRTRVTDDSGWTEKHTSETIKVWTKAADPNGPGAGLNVVKINCFFDNVDPTTMYDALHDPEFRKSWDHNMIEGFNISQLDERNDVGYYAVKFPFPLANRDFLNQRMWAEFENGEYIIKNNMVTHRDCPEKKGFVRATSIISGYYLRPWRNGTELLYMTHSDVKGSVPHAILNSATQRMAPSMMATLGKNSGNYAQWAQENHPAGWHAPWRTPKVPWEPRGGEEEESLDEEALSSEDVYSDAAPAAQVEAMKQHLGEAHRGRHGQMTLAPVAPRVHDDPKAIQQYRALMQEACVFVDTQFLEEGRVPSLEEYLSRLRSVVAGMRRGGGD